MGTITSREHPKSLLRAMRAGHIPAATPPMIEASLSASPPAERMMILGSCMPEHWLATIAKCVRPIPEVDGNDDISLHSPEPSPLISTSFYNPCRQGCRHRLSHICSSITPSTSFARTPALAPATPPAPSVQPPELTPLILRPGWILCFQCKKHDYKNLFLLLLILSYLPYL